MYRFHVKRLILTYLITPLAFGNPFPTNTTSAPAPALPVLESDQFIKAVDENNTKIQNELNTKLANLLGTSSPTTPTPIITTPSSSTSTSVEIPKTSPTTEETPENNSLASPSAPTGTGLNPYIN